MNASTKTVGSGVDIAIVGMAARFPGAADVDQFWANLRDGVESIRRLSDDELVAAGVNHSALSDPDYVKASPVLDNVDKFDAAFFGFSARDASVMDPAHRIFLEVAWHAFENAGYSALPEEGPVGVFAAAGAPLYMMENLRTNPDLMKSMGEFLVRHTGNDMNFLATRVSYEMDLRGPSMNVQTACSSSLVSVHLACQSLASGECVLALAGGATVLVPQAQGYHFKEGEILSPDGHCRPFDAKSAGTVFGSGAGAVILKRLSDALDDGDTIHAVIKGSAINNDGAMKVSYLAPGVEGQAAVVGSALANAGVDADSISYIEAHGTGTLVGDPIEVEALNEAYRSRTSRQGYCAIGSVKSNIGHLGEAAGAASLIKAVMALKHRQLPPTLGFERLNPAIDLAASPFFINDRLRAWEGEGALRCGVTALGAGGTNCHLIVEEAPPALTGVGNRSQQLILLSAKTKTALDLASDNLAAALKKNSSADLADAAYTLAIGRRGMPYRRAIAATSLPDAVRLLRDRDAKRTVNGIAEEHSPKVVFMFPGGGAQYAGMGRELYEQEEVYRNAVDACLSIIEPALGINLKALMYPASENLEMATRELERPSLTLPALFATEYAMARQFMAWGVTPSAMIGHSVGEYAAACISGVFSLEDAIKLVLMRGRLFEVVPPGRMLSVPLSEKELRALMPADLDIAAANAPELSVASGSSGAIAKLQSILAAQEIESTPIHINVAAHSSMLDPVLSQFRDLCRTIRLRPPGIPFVSNVTGTWISTDQAMSADYWVSHLRSTVRFADGLSSISELGAVALLEVGPGRTLSMLARAQAKPFQHAFSCIRHPQETASDLGFALTSLGRLWSVGADIDWTAFYDGQLRNRIPLPAYPFEGKSFWVTPGKASVLAPSTDVSRQTDLANWFHTVGYAEAPLVTTARSQKRRIWLVLAEDAADAKRLTRAMGHDRIVVATTGKTFGERIDGTWRFDFDDADHYAKIVQYMEESVGLPDHVVLLTSASLKASSERRFFSPVRLLQVLGGLSSDVQVSIVTHGATGAGGGLVDPVSALVLGPALVGPREFDQIQTRCIDLPIGKLIADEQQQLTSALVRELREEAADPIVALSQTARWVRHLSALPLPALAEETPVDWVRDGGVYLVTGGLGGIGLEVAEHLARTRKVKLALMGREGLPPEADWDRILLERPQSRSAQRIARVRKLRELGAQVKIIRGDVASRSDVASAVRAVRQAFGPICGVIHGAGVMHDAPMMTKDLDAMKRVLAPKVAGTLALDAEITEDLEFFMLFSSVASYLGLPGQVDYTAANAFQDAFARARAVRAKGRTVVVNWNAWRDVGMAAMAHRALTVGVEPARRSSHPAFNGYTDTAKSRIFVATFEDTAEWLLTEHVVKGGPAVLPGTAFVELARAAYAEDRDAGAIELSDMVFVSPFSVEAGEPRRLTVQVTPSGDGATITMRSGTELTSQPIVTGEARSYRGDAPTPLNLANIRARALREFAPADQRLDQCFMTFGPRWANILRVAYGQSEALVELALPEPFLADLPGYALHPAVFDMATGGAQQLIPGVDLTKHFFVPLGYARVRIFGPMPARVFSHVRCLPETGNGVAYFDVTLADAGGKVFAEISRFTMRRIETASVFTQGRPRTPVVQSSTLGVALKNGIAANEGIEALNRIMAQCGLIQVVASSVDVIAWNDKLRTTRVQAVEQAGSVESFQRPAGAPEYLAPSSAAERVLAKIWSDLLGYQPIGVQDNFFDMGGNSLQGVRLFAGIRKRFSVSLPLATLFQAQTIADLAKLLAEPEQDAVTSTAGWSPLVCLKPGVSGHTPVYLIHGSRGNVLVFKSFADRVKLEQPVYALQAAGVDGKMVPDSSIEVMAERYLEAIRKVQPRGPYMFAGYSGGGVIAYEIARRLKSVGEETSVLMLIDTLEPSQMRTSVTMLDRVRNIHRIKLHRFINLPAVLWKYWLRQRIRQAMGVQEIQPLRTPLEAASDAVDAAYKVAQWAYNTPQFETNAVLIRATDARMHFLRSGPTLGWGAFVKGEIRRFDVDAEHDFVFEGAALSQLVVAFDQAVATGGAGAGVSFRHGYSTSVQSPEPRHYRSPSWRRLRSEIRR